MTKENPVNQNIIETIEIIKRELENARQVQEIPRSLDDLFEDIATTDDFQKIFQTIFTNDVEKTEIDFKLVAAIEALVIMILNLKFPPSLHNRFGNYIFFSVVRHIYKDFAVEKALEKMS